MEEDLKKTKNYPRKKLVAFILSAFIPGLGQLYNGQLKKSVIYSIGLLLLPIGFNLMGLKQYFWIYASLIILFFVLRIAIAIEAMVVAGRTKEYHLKKFNKWYIYISTILIWHLTVYVGLSITESTRYKSFIVRSDSGNPNLISGDYVYGDFEFYNSKQPDYGELVVVSTETGSYVFRIVGLPHDTLSIENNTVKHKNKKSFSTLISSLNWKNIETEECVETLPNGFNYHIYRNKTPFDTATATIKNIIVPTEYYYVLGDNRDFSADSRIIGFIHRQQIQGKLKKIYYSDDFSKINTSLEKPG